MAAAEWPLATLTFDGDAAAGPVPRLFAENQELAREALESDPARAFRDIQRIMARFPVPENIPASQAMDFVSRPRYRK